MRLAQCKHAEPCTLQIWRQRDSAQEEFGGDLLQEPADTVVVTQQNAEDFQSLLITRKIGSSPHHTSASSGSGSLLSSTLQIGRRTPGTAPNLDLNTMNTNSGAIPHFRLSDNVRVAQESE